MVRRSVIQLFEELYDRFEGDEFLTLTLRSIPDPVPLIKRWALLYQFTVSFANIR